MKRVHTDSPPAPAGPARSWLSATLVRTQRVRHLQGLQGPPVAAPTPPLVQCNVALPKTTTVLYALSKCHHRRSYFVS